VVDDDNLSEEDAAIFQAFAAARRQAYRPTVRDRALLAQLRAAGYQPAEILAAIQRGVAGAWAAGQHPRQFSYVVPIVREQPPGAAPARLVLPPEVAPPVLSGPPSEPATGPAATGPQSASDQTSHELATVPSGPSDRATLQAFCAARGLTLTPAQLQDLLVLARDYAAAAAQAGQTGRDWVMAALQAVDSSVTNPVRYVRAILKRWQDRPPETRPRAADAPAAAGDDAEDADVDDQEADAADGAAPAVEEPAAPEPTITLADGQVQPVAQFWRKALAELELQLTRATFDTWLRGSVCVGLADPTTLTVQVKNTYAVEWLSHRLAPVIQRTLTRLAGQACSAQFVVVAGSQVSG
jgi:hypothetical protein